MKRLVLLLICCASLALPAAERSLADLEAMAALVAPLPVQHKGRLKPFDTVARHYLLALSGKSTVPVPEQDATLSASAWMLEAIVDREQSAQRPAVRLREFEVADWLGLERRHPLAVTDPALTWRYSFDELQGPLEEKWGEVQELSRAEQATLSRVEVQLLNLVDAITSFLNAVQGGLANVPGPAEARETWEGPHALINRQAEDPLQRQVLRHWMEILQAATTSDVASLREHAQGLQELVAPHTDHDRLRAEVWMNDAHLFSWSMVGYILAAVAALLSLVILPRVSAWSAFGLLSLGFITHTIGLVLRVYVMQRPPVGTLYESVIFVGWGIVLLGLICECFVRQRGLFVFLAAVLGIALHLVAFGYADDGDTMGMLVAVLNSKFWLMTHVLTIAIGYSCSLACGGMAHIHLASLAVSPGNHRRNRELQRLTHALALIALFFTLFGTILGGIWADMSWGRFWGWDPKENGALLIVLWLLLMLHLRLSKLPALWLSAGLTLTNIIVILAWFGVNLLGIGLHSYGFTDGVAYNILYFSLAEFVLIGLLTLGAWLRSGSRANQELALDPGEQAAE